MRSIPGWIVGQGWSCRRVSDELNALGVPTAYGRDDPGYRRMKGRKPIWRPGRVLHMVRLEVLKGVMTYGKLGYRRGIRDEVLKAAVPALIDPDTWDAAKLVVTNHRLKPLNGKFRLYLLRGKVWSPGCGLSYCGVNGKDGDYCYSCNAKVFARGAHVGRCPCRSIPDRWIEEIVWNDTERILFEPEEVIEELCGSSSDPGTANGTAESEVLDLKAQMDELLRRRKEAERFLVDGRVSEETFDELRVELEQEMTSVTRRLGAVAR